jgi:2-(1,2-epoxy-1,2-dihydrophenyl)acetyl-CoA isomerase
MGDSGHEAVLLRKQGAVTQLVLNRPLSLNAIDEEMAAGLRDGLELVAVDRDCRCLTITGTGRGFCAGQSLAGSPDSEMLPQAVGGLIRSRYVPIISLIRSVSVVVVAEVNGLATGSGFAIALAADIRLASEAAWFSCGFSKIGLVPDSGASFFLSRYLGYPKAFEIAATGRRISAAEALSLGLVSRVYPADTFAADCLAFAEEVAAGPTRALALTKKALDLGLVQTLEEQMELEAVLQQEASETDDFREGLDAFRERRAPRFEGR